MNYSVEQITEIAKCYNDIEYFADNYIKFSTVDGVVQSKLNDFQRSVIHDYKDKKVFYIPTGRQEGKTTVAAIILLHQALFTESRVSLIFARTKAMSNYIIDIITEMYDRLPDFMASVKMTTRNKSKIEFENLCSIISAGSDINHGRGRAISTIYIDESEWFDNLDDVVTKLYPCMASVSYAKMFALSSSFTGDSFRRLEEV